MKLVRYGLILLLIFSVNLYGLEARTCAEGNFYWDIISRINNIVSGKKGGSKNYEAKTLIQSKLKKHFNCMPENCMLSDEENEEDKKDIFSNNLNNELKKAQELYDMVKKEADKEETTVPMIYTSNV